MQSKRKDNTTGIKIKFLPVTNTKPSRYRIIQTNSGKSVIVNAQLDDTPLTHFSNVLDGIEEVKSFSLVTDNTQNDYYLFSVDFNGSSFENILEYFK